MYDPLKDYSQKTEKHTVLVIFHSLDPTQTLKYGYFSPSDNVLKLKNHFIGDDNKNNGICGDRNLRKFLDDRAILKDLQKSRDNIRQIELYEISSKDENIEQYLNDDENYE